MALYMKYGSIDGAAATQGYEKWIELSSFQWGVSRGIGTAARGATSREATEPSISEIVVTKLTDVATPKLVAESWSGLLNNKVVVKFTTTNKGNQETYQEFELTNTGLSGYSVSSGGDLPSESLSLNFTKIQYKFTGMDPGVSGSPEAVAFDLPTMKGS
jgi:type VI secretion system secreted protein Hcp